MEHGGIFKDMKWQKNHDIITQILTAINERRAPTRIVKVTSHRGVALNEMADADAGAAADASPEDMDSRYAAPPPDDTSMIFTWLDGKKEVVLATDQRIVIKRMTRISQEQNEEAVLRAATMGGTFMLKGGWGHHLLHASRVIRPWTDHP